MNETKPERVARATKQANEKAAEQSANREKARAERDAARATRKASMNEAKEKFRAAQEAFAAAHTEYLESVRALTAK